MIHSLSALIQRHVNEILDQWLSSEDMKHFFEKYGIEPDYFCKQHATPWLKTISLGGELSFIGRGLVEYLINRDVSLVDFDKLFSSYRQSVISYALQQEHWSPDDIHTLLAITDTHRQQIAKYYSDVLLLGSEKSKKELIRFRQYQKVLDKSAIVSKTDPKGIITYVNEAFCTISGYSLQELIGQPHNIVRHPDTDSEIFRELWSTIQAKKVFKGIIKNRRKNGEPYYVDATIVPILNEENKIVEYIGLRYDISQLVEAVELSQKAQKAKDGFLANMSHEIRTPLNAIIGFINVLSKHIQDETGKHYLQIIDNSAQMLLSIINDVLDLSKLQSGKFTVTSEPFDPISILSSSVTLFQSKVQEKSLSYAVFIDPNIPPCLVGDSLRITQILSNFLSNAIKFTPNHGILKINALYEHNRLSVMVQDSGIGISFDQQRKIFEPFEQADGSITKTYGGTGLGLSISSELISQMGGELIFRSVENKGSLFGFHLDLPVCDFEFDTNRSYRDYSSLRIAIGSHKSRDNQIKLIEKYLKHFGIKEIDHLHETTEQEYDAIFVTASAKHVDRFSQHARHVVLLERSFEPTSIHKETLLCLREPFLPKEIDFILEKIQSASHTK